MSPQRWIDFSMLVEIGCYSPGTVIKVEEEDHAFPDVDKKANVAAASILRLARTYL